MSTNNNIFSSNDSTLSSLSSSSSDNNMEPPLLTAPKDSRMMDVDSDEPVKKQKFETLDELHQKYKVLEVAFEKLKLMEIELLSDADATEEMVKNANDKSNFAKSRLD